MFFPHLNYKTKTDPTYDWVVGSPYGKSTSNQEPDEDASYEKLELPEDNVLLLLRVEGMETDQYGYLVNNRGRIYFAIGIESEDQTEVPLNRVIEWDYVYKAGTNELYEINF